MEIQFSQLKNIVETMDENTLLAIEFEKEGYEKEDE